MNLPLLNTITAKWRDPGQTNPRGFLAVDVPPHPMGGLEARNDDDGQGLAVKVLAAGPASSWPSGVPVNGMPLHLSELGELWAPPYPSVKFASSTALPLSAGSPSGSPGELAQIAAPVTLTLTNDSPYPMLFSRRVIVRDAQLVNAQTPVSYALVIDGATGAPWPLFTAVPDSVTTVDVVDDTATLDSVADSPYVVSVDPTVSIKASRVAWSGSVNLPSVLVAAGEAYSFSAATAVIFQIATDPFEIQVGETTVELIGWAVADSSFGIEA